MTNVFKIPEAYISDHPEVMEDFLNALADFARKYGKETPDTVGEAFKYAIGEIIIQHGEAVGMIVEYVIRCGVGQLDKAKRGP